MPDNLKDLKSDTWLQRILRQDVIVNLFFLNIIEGLIIGLLVSGWSITLLNDNKELELKEEVTQEKYDSWRNSNEDMSAYFNILKATLKRQYNIEIKIPSNLKMKECKNGK